MMSVLPFISMIKYIFAPTPLVYAPKLWKLKTIYESHVRGFLLHYLIGRNAEHLFMIYLKTTFLILSTNNCSDTAVGIEVFITCYKLKFWMNLQTYFNLSLSSNLRLLILFNFKRYLRSILQRHHGLRRLGRRVVRVQQGRLQGAVRSPAADAGAALHDRYSVCRVIWL